MVTLDILKARLSELKPKLQEEYSITQLGIFGSHVRGEQTDNSDIDILVEFAPDISFGLVTFCNLENQLSELLGARVDLVMKDALKPHIGEQVLKEVVYL